MNSYDYLRAYLKQNVGKKTGITQAYLAKIAGIKQPALSKFINKKQGLEVETIDKMADGLGITLEEWLNEGKKILTKNIINDESPATEIRLKNLAIAPQINNEHAEVIEDFKLIMSGGGEMAEELAEMVKAIAKKRREEAENKNSYTAEIKSA